MDLKVLKLVLCTQLLMLSHLPLGLEFTGGVACDTCLKEGQIQPAVLFCKVTAHFACSKNWSGLKAFFFPIIRILFFFSQEMIRHNTYASSSKVGGAICWGKKNIFVL